MTRTRIATSRELPKGDRPKRRAKHSLRIKKISSKNGSRYTPKVLCLPVVSCKANVVISCGRCRRMEGPSKEQPSMACRSTVASSDVAFRGGVRTCPGGIAASCRKLARRASRSFRRSSTRTLRRYKLAWRHAMGRLEGIRSRKGRLVRYLQRGSAVKARRNPAGTWPHRLFLALSCILFSGKIDPVRSHPLPRACAFRVADRACLCIFPERWESLAPGPFRDVYHADSGPSLRRLRDQPGSPSARRRPVWIYVHAQETQPPCQIRTPT